MNGGRRSLVWLATTVMAAVLTACAVPVPIPVPIGADAPALSRVGRFALRIDDVDGKQNAVQGSFAWRDDGHSLVLDLVSPLGATLARVEASPGQALLRESNGKETRAANPDELVSVVLGSDIPVAGLRDWLHGRLSAQPAVSGLIRDEQGRPASFEQAGWYVKAAQYDSQGPTRLQMARNEAGQEVDLRLVITP